MKLSPSPVAPGGHFITWPLLLMFLIWCADAKDETRMKSPLGFNSSPSSSNWVHQVQQFFGGAPLEDPNSNTLTSPEPAVVDNKNRIVYFVSQEHHCIRSNSLDDERSEIINFAGVCNEPGYINGPSLQARFRSPVGLVFNDIRNELVFELFTDVKDENNSVFRVRKIMIETGEVSTMHENLTPFLIDQTGISSKPSRVIDIEDARKLKALLSSRPVQASDIPYYSCPPNHYNPSLDMANSKCLKCPANAKCSRISFACLEGYELSFAGNQCHQCQSGFFKFKVGNGQCLKCPAEATNCTSTSIESCQPGWKLNESRNDCVRLESARRRGPRFRLAREYQIMLVQAIFASLVAILLFIYIKISKMYTEHEEKKRIHHLEHRDRRSDPNCQYCPMAWFQAQTDYRYDFRATRVSITTH